MKTLTLCLFFLSLTRTHNKNKVLFFGVRRVPQMLANLPSKDSLGAHLFFLKKISPSVSLFLFRCGSHPNQTCAGMSCHHHDRYITTIPPSQALPPKTSTKNNKHNTGGHHSVPHPHIILRQDIFKLPQCIQDVALTPASAFLRAVIAAFTNLCRASTSRLSRCVC